MKTYWIAVSKSRPIGKAVGGFFESKQVAESWGGDFLISIEDNNGVYAQSEISEKDSEYNIKLWISVYANAARPGCPYVIGFHGSEREARECPSACRGDDPLLAVLPVDLDAGLYRQMPNAGRLLTEACEALKQRATVRDTPTGERSAARAAAIVTAWTGREVTEADVWRVLMAVKMARSVQGQFHADDYVDMAGYAALLGESEGEQG